MVMLYSTKRVTVKKKMRRDVIILSCPATLYSKKAGVHGPDLMENGSGPILQSTIWQTPDVGLDADPQASSEENSTFF
jgi:hypothetical protein